MPSSIALPPLWEPRPPPAQSKDGVPANRNQTQRRIFRLLVALTALIALWDQPLLPMGLSPNTKVFSALAVTKQRPQVASYDRAAFGDGWATLPDGSTTREAIIAHQLGPGGTGTDPYSGAPIAAARGHGAHPIEVDHIYPLAAAWDMGAYSWDATQRRQFANDPLNLVAVASHANREKSDQLPSQWLPPDRGARCAYAHRLAAVALTYNLPVTVADRRAMTGACQLTLRGLFGLG